MGGRGDRHARRSVALRHGRLYRRLPRAIRLELPARGTRSGAARRPILPPRPTGPGGARAPRGADRTTRPRVRGSTAGFGELGYACDRLSLDGAAHACCRRPVPVREVSDHVCARRSSPRTGLPGDVAGRRRDAGRVPLGSAGARGDAVLRRGTRRRDRRLLRAVPARRRRAGGGREHPRGVPAARRGRRGRAGGVGGRARGGRRPRVAARRCRATGRSGCTPRSGSSRSAASWQFTKVAPAAPPDAGRGRHSAP